MFAPISAAAPGVQILPGTPIAGQFEEPLRAITRAQELDPQFHAILANRGLILFYAGKAEEAIALLQDLTRNAPKLLSPHYYLATIYLDQQRYGDYLQETLTAARLEGNAGLETAIGDLERAFDERAAAVSARLKR